MRPLTDQVVLICGASRGIGAAVAKQFSHHCSRLVIHYHEAHQQAESIAASCRLNDCDVLCYAADVRHRIAVRDMVDSILQKWGRIDSIVYCAGVGKYGLFQNMTEHDFDLLMNTHVRGAFNVLQAAAPALLNERQGRIVLISSIWGSTGGAGEVLYSTAKGAVNAMTKALAKEWAPSGITVNAVAPGAIATEMLDPLTDEDLMEMKAVIPLDRVGEPAEIATWVTHLCQPTSGYMTGQILHVNGGWFTP